MRATAVLSCAACLCAGALVAPASSWAQGAEPWKFQASIYGFFPDMGGTTTFPPGSGNSSSATVDSGTILDNLKFTFMGSLEATRGAYGVYTDLIYLNLGNDKQQSRALTLGGSLPADVAADLRYELNGWLWTLAGTWRALSTPTYRMDVLAGTRMLDITQKLDWQLTGNIGSIPLQDRTGHRSTDLQNWDLIVGVKGRAAFGDDGRWFVPYYLDLGTGESKFTWQAMAGVGYSFGWGDVLGIWRYVDYDMKSGKAVESLNFNGPAIAAVFRW